MNKELLKIKRLIETIEPIEPESRQKYIDGIAKAKEAYQAAIDTKESADTEQEFEAAFDAEIHAKEKQAFFERKLDELTFTPMINETDYNMAIDLAESVMAKAAAEYRQVASRCIAEITAAKEKYQQTAEDADSLLIDLDRVSNFLQCKYRYREYTNTEGIVRKIEAPSEWKEHQTRYLTGISPKAYGLAVHTQQEHACYRIPELSNESMR